MRTMKLVRRTLGFACATLVYLLASSGPARAQGVIYACVTANGAIRIVGATESCKANETRVQWSVVGPTGATGATGAQGVPGAIGPTGSQGQPGAVGPTGAQGATGPQGSTGSQGSTGAQGLPGAIGPTGAQGQQGVVGPTGPQGLAGSAGGQGAIGPTGPAGPAGASGAQGPQGLQGPQGTKGDKGDPGDAIGGKIIGQLQACAPNVDFSGALVFVPGRAFSVFTGSAGAFTIDSVPPGSYELAVEVGGHIVAQLANVQVADVPLTLPQPILTTNLQTDGQNCGTCGNTCATNTCVSGSCQQACLINPQKAGFLCGTACVDPQTDTSNCGGCGINCGPNGTCTNGQCIPFTCNPGQTNCNGTCVDLLTNASNCGACGNVCQQGPGGGFPFCAAGTCVNVCQLGDPSQGLNGFGIVCGQACVDAINDTNNCGACGHICAPGQICATGVCAACPAGQTLCNGTCRNVTSDPANCGACGQACQQGQVCTAGQCVTGCQQGQVLCNGACIDTTVDPANCGACGIVCQQGQACVSGKCFASSCQPSPEVCDGIDNDCNGLVDDNLGTLSCGTGACFRSVQACLNGVPQLCAPGVPSAEICNGVDDNCDGQIDEGNPGGGQQCNTGLVGACAAGVTACQAGALACSPTVQPTAEVCDGIDNNCNGQIDEGAAGIGQACSTGQVGVCSAGTTACQLGSFVCARNIQPTAEICNGLDDNCNGAVDDGNPGGGLLCSTGLLGVCGAGITACSAGAILCNQTTFPTVEICDNQDNNCNGQVDEGNPGGNVACNTGLQGACALGHTQCTPQGLICIPNQGGCDLNEAALASFAPPRR